MPPYLKRQMVRISPVHGPMKSGLQYILTKMERFADTCGVKEARDKKLTCVLGISWLFSNKKIEAY